MFLDPLERKMEHFPFDIERWYPSLASVTFDSKFLNLPHEVAQAFVNYYQRRYNKKDHLTPDDCRQIRAFQPKLEEAIRSVNSPSGKVFVRLSNRSPKDGTRPGVDVKSLVRQELEKIPGNPDANARMIAICRASRALIAVRDADEALELILSSERVFRDLILALDCRKLEEEDEKCEISWSTQVCIRAWNEDVRDELEFRCFIYQGSLTAISQYNHYCLYDFGDLKEDIIRARLVAFWSRIKHMITPQNYILDVALIEPSMKESKPDDDDYQGPREILIELNPFKRTTGGCMYCWKLDDKLLKDRDSIDVRLRTEKLPNLDLTVEVYSEQFQEPEGSFRDLLNIVSPPEKSCTLF